MEIKPGDVVRLRKQHPCGGSEWQVVKPGAEIEIECLKCQHHVLLKRSVFQRRLKAFISRGQQISTERIKELEAKIADLKARWPAHSVPPSMWQQLEALEDELEKANQERQATD